MAKIDPAGRARKGWFPVCLTCGQDEVSCDAYATYSKTKGAWVLDDLQDNAFCHHCHEECHWEMVATHDDDLHYHLDLDSNRYDHDQDGDCKMHELELTETQKQRLAVLMLVSDRTGVEGVGVRLSRTAFIIDGGG